MFQNMGVLALESQGLNRAMEHIPLGDGAGDLIFLGEDHGPNSPRHIASGDTLFHSLSLKKGKSAETFFYQRSLLLFEVSH
jgi:hypothetical protein